MPPPKCKLTDAEIRRAFSGRSADVFPPIVAPGQLAQLFGISTKTMYEWITKGRLDGAFRRRGKPMLIWRDRAIELIFTGKEWEKNG